MINNNKKNNLKKSLNNISKSDIFKKRKISLTLNKKLRIFRSLVHKKKYLLPELKTFLKFFLKKKRIFKRDKRISKQKFFYLKKNLNIKTKLNKSLNLINLKLFLSRNDYIFNKNVKDKFYDNKLYIKSFKNFYSLKNLNLKKKIFNWFKKNKKIFFNLKKNKFKYGKNKFYYNSFYKTSFKPTNLESYFFNSKDWFKKKSLKKKKKNFY